ncbi:vWA domain-containing protein [Wenzhouxiangella sediminis]|uniref:VWA domain-containing protein n=1 Tax=Wenzhouxiangella sediminis TaxID=1792836 RepID=A0A3E1KAG7_9GAMM|nr:VWA domain-containing protein [Wenzhouxiangella sediminis]RFF31290.1 VWA domain-containing protein [Wenzhouxiangella sediminis]
MSQSIRNSSIRRRALAAAAAAAVALAAGCASQAPETGEEHKPVSEPAPRTEVDLTQVTIETASEQERRFRQRPVRVEEALADRAAPGQPMAFAPSPASPGADPLAHLRAPDRPINRENYDELDPNPIHRVSEQPVSTFSIDVDTGSYANVRRMLNAGQLPPKGAVRVEEMINYFDYDYPAPEDPSTPFNVVLEQAASPWNENTRLLQIGIKGFVPPPEDVPPANLVFLVDVSGSMHSPDKLGLLKNALKMLAGQLDGDDRVAMVVYAGATGVVLESTPGDQAVKIRNALDQLQAGGRTNGAAGIELAYAQARQGFIEGGINRIILATDGDFNVGTVDFDALVDLVERNRQSGVALTTLGFGTGNYNDHLMEQLADAGDGNHAYIDTLGEARKVLVDEMGATLHTIARDVKIQVEFNPAVVAEYRLIGYENRMLAREDFNNDAVDAGDIGAGHTVTALYELALVGSGGERMDPLRYGAARATREISNELGIVRLRYKQPESDSSQLIERPVPNLAAESASERLRFAAAVAAFGQHLRGGKYLEGFSMEDVHALARDSKGADAFGYRGEFLQLVRLADGLAVARRYGPNERTIASDGH